jgi:hypothetical protein
MFTSVVCIFILAPACAWFAVSLKPAYQAPAESVKPATKAELRTAIDNYNRTKTESPRYFTVKDIISSERLHTWWYLVKVRVESIDPDLDNTSEAIMLFVKFKDDSTSTRVVTGPNDKLYYDNISGQLGVPYDVIDKLNKAIGE